MATKKTIAKKPAAKKAAPKKAAPKKAATPKKAAPKKAAPKKAATPKRTMSAEERARYKVSPLRGMDLEKWFATSISGWQADLVRRVVAMVSRVAPQATVEIKWRQPVFAMNGKDFLVVRGAKAHVAIGLWQGIEVADPKGLFDDSRFHKVTDPAKFDEKAFAEVVKQASRARG